MPRPEDLPLQHHVTAFDPIEIGHLRLPNRIVMAPMTRSRAAGAGLATALMARYYAQRASAGLIITEGIQPCVVGQGYPNTPGLHTVEQVRSWRGVTQAVHAAGGRTFAQLLHAGRIGHPGLLPHGLSPVAPSAVAANGTVFTPNGMEDLLTPRRIDRLRSCCHSAPIRGRCPQRHHRRVRRRGGARRQRLPRSPIPLCIN
jgi:N-ethylmaleimide reductase